jgi:hypothetical protein
MPWGNGKVLEAARLFARAKLYHKAVDNEVVNR